MHTAMTKRKVAGMPTVKKNRMTLLDFGLPCTFIAPSPISVLLRSQQIYRFLPNGIGGIYRPSDLADTKKVYHQISEKSNLATGMTVL